MYKPFATVAGLSRGLLLLLMLALTGMMTLVPAAASIVASDASSEDDPGLRPAVADDFDPVEHGLSPQPLIVAPLGLAMYAPDGIITSDRSNGQLVLTIHERASSPSWSLTIQHLQSPEPVSPETQISQHLAALRAAKNEISVIENRPFAAGSASGHLCYIHQTVENVFGASESLISGWLILPSAPDVSLVFSIQATPDSLPFLRNTLEASFATIKMRSAVELSLERRSRMDAGRAFLKSITPERLREVIGTRQWSRIYRPDGEGNEQEIGYSLLEVYEGVRGELDPDRPQSGYTDADKTPGLMVRLQGRVVGDVQRRVFYDSLALYWMSWDQSEEAWTVRGTQRQGQAQRSEVETGLRMAPTVAKPRETLRVTRVRSGDYESTPFEWARPEVYLSQAMATVLGRLLAADTSTPREMAYYFYHYGQAQPQMTRRIDQWAPAGDGSGNWNLITQLSVDAPPIISTYSPNGDFIQTRRMDGTTTTSSSIEEIQRIWTFKGLPMSD